MTMYRLLPEESRLTLFRSIKFAKYYYESDMETWLKQNLHVLTDGAPLLPIGQQLATPYSGTLDLLALDADGNVVVIELKRGKPPRDAIAQALEYAAWAADQTPEAILARADSYLRPDSLARRWAETFATQDDTTPPDELPAHVRLNERQRIFLVVEGYSERITAVAQYLRKKGIDFNLVTFHYYRTDSGEEMLNFELSVGPDQDGMVTPTGGGQGENTEEAVLARWSTANRIAYGHFRERLLSADDTLQIDPKAAAISIRMQMRDRKTPVYLCSFEPDRGGGESGTIAFKKPSLKDFLDVEAAIRAIGNDLPEGVTLSNKPEWATLTFEPTPELAARMADLIRRHMITPLNGN